MTTLPRFQALDERLQALMPPLPGIEHSLDLSLATLFPGFSPTARSLYFDNHTLLNLVGAHLFDGGTFRVPSGSRPRHTDYPALVLPPGFDAHIQRFCQNLRQDTHARLAAYWQARDSKGLTRITRLASWYRDLLDAQIRLRRSDQTLSAAHVQLLQTCLERPYPWQRRDLPVANRPQVYRPLLTATAPNWRSHLPGFLILTEQGPEGRLLEHHEAVGRVLLCSVAHGIEAFDSLAELHVELCERLEDPNQGEHLVKWLISPSDKQRARQAERLRYDWYTEDLAQAQAQSICDVQTKRLTAAWQQAWDRGQQRHIEHLDSALTEALDMQADIGSQGPLATRYGLLLEKHLPNWMRSTPPQGVAHIMQAMQDQIAAVEAARATGILTLEAFNQEHSLLEWVRARLREYLQRDPGLDTDPRDIRVSVTLARQIGPIVNPLPIGGPNSYIPVASRQEGDTTIELVNHTYRLDELALLNIAWFDVNYWLTARVHLADNRPLEALTPQRVKDIVRRLNAGSGYQAYLRTQLLDSPQGRWRQSAHGQLNRTRMRADAVKARYAGHFITGPTQQGYAWADAVIGSPDNHLRATVGGQQVIVKQMLIQSHTLLGVLLIVSQGPSKRIVVYCPDAPDRRYWREYANAKALIRAIRNDQHLRNYVIQRLPLTNPKAIEALLLKGRLGSHVELREIDGNLYEAAYRAEVNSLMAQTNAVTRSNEELLGEFSVNVFRLLLDIVTLILPHKALVALAFGRMGVSLWEGLDALDQDDHEGALHHAIAAFGYASDGLSTLAGSAVIRRVMRGLPKPPSVPLPEHYEAEPEVARLRYRIDAAHGEAVYEQVSNTSKLSQYYVQDNHGRYFNVSFDGTRWRATDPNQPEAYLKLPIKRLEDGSWVIDSPVLWYDGLPDLEQLLGDCRLDPPLPGIAVEGEAGLFEDNATLYLQLHMHQLPVRRHLLAGHYHLVLSPTLRGKVPAWAVLRQHDGQWQIRVRQPGRSSEWLALPDSYSASLGSTASSR